MMWARNLLVVIACFALTLICSAQEAAVRLRADQWMPFNGTPDAEKPGYVVEIVREIFIPQGVSVDYAIMPWEDALKAAVAGEVDGAIGTNAVEGISLVCGNEPIGIPKVGLFARKNNPWKYENLQSLNAIKVGVIAGYSYWESFDAYIKSHTGKNVVSFTGDDPLTEALAKLHAKEIDVMPETLPVFAWALKTRGEAFSDYQIAFIFEGEPIFIGFTKNERGRRFARILDKGIRELRANGKLAKILVRYGLKDWQE